MSKCTKCGCNFVGAPEQMLPNGLCKYCEIESLKAALAVAIAERDSFAQSYDNIDHRHNVLTEKHQSLSTLCAELVEAGKKLTLKLDLIHDDQLYKWVWQSFQIHGGDYTNGPKYDVEKAVFEKALAHYAELLKKKEESSK